MKIIFAGTGSAFTMSNYQTNTVICKGNKKLLIDAGGDIRHCLRNVRLSFKDIDALYITHLHADHIGGVEYLAFSSYFTPGQEKISLIANSELVRELWNTSLRGGLKSIQGKKTTLDDYFDVQMIKKNGRFVWEDIEFRIVQSVHVVDEYSIVPSYGLMITDPESKRVIYYTGDTQFCPNQIMDFYKQADLIIHDCETSAFKSGVHANYLDLVTLPADVKKKMLLVHYQDNVLATDTRDGWQASARDAGFMSWNNRAWGFVPYGLVFDLSIMAQTQDQAC